MLKWSLPGGLLWIPAMLLIFILAGCAGGSSVAGVSAVTETPTSLPPTSTPLPSATPTSIPTATQEPTATFTHTPLPPTSTPVPPLAVQPEGFQAWCAPVAYAGTRPQAPAAPDYARPLAQADGQYRVPIPATYCVIAFQFNQPVQDGLELRVLDGQNPFIRQPLDPVQGQPDSVWTTLLHSYVVDPPYWQVTYTLTVLDSAGSELWSSPITFARPLPEECLFGGLPDPVTLYCAVTDPWEIEPKPGVVYPYDRSRLLTPHPDD